MQSSLGNFGCRAVVQSEGQVEFRLDQSAELLDQGPDCVHLSQALRG